MGALMHIYFNHNVVLVCSVCSNLNASITEEQIFCNYCGWTRRRRYPVPYKRVPNWFSPLTIKQREKIKQLADVFRPKDLSSGC